MSELRKVLPTKTLLQGCSYVNSASTDIKARFERMKRERLQKEAANVTQIKRQK